MDESREDIEIIWKRFKENWNEADRNYLIEYYLPFARNTAFSAVRKLPNSVDRENHMAEGVLGLTDAVEGFDLSRGLKFETYCVPRIRGAVMDSLRNNDFIPRLVRRNRRLWEKVVEVHGMDATLEQAAELLEVDVQVAERIKNDYKEQLPVIGAFKIVSSEDSDREALMNEPRVEDVSPMEQQEEQEAFKSLLKGMTHTQVMAMTLYHRDNFTMKSIASLLGLSESRVSQMVTQATQTIKRMKKCQLGAR
jgi:RNA polymerase sigma factor for flagellar operon FliA